MRSLRAVLLGACVLLWMGCKRTKDTFTSRTYHEMTSRFNPLFNGREAFDAGLAKFYAQYKEDFGAVLPVYVWTNAQSAPLLAAEMDKAMEKGVKVIQDHNMNIKEEQKNEYIDDSYLLVGVARFYKAEYFPAMETFNYITQQFKKDPIAFESRLWSARCKIQVGNTAAAGSELETLAGERDLPEELKAEVNATLAQLEINRKQWEAAAEFLDRALREKPKKAERVRWTYVRAQCLEKAGRGPEASEQYEAVLKMRPPYDFAFNAQLSRALTYDVYANDPQVVYKELEKMAADEKNKDNRDQIYAANGELAAKDEDWPKAEENFKKSVRSSTVNAGRKGLSYLRLGEIDFDFKNYFRAQAYYDSASTTLPPEHPRLAAAAQRAATLDRLVRDMEVMAEQDSLLRLSTLSPAEREKAVDDLIARLQKEAERKAEEEALRALNKELAEAALAEQGPKAGGGAVGKWYFYNPTLVSGGQADFRKKWGNRKLADNWRWSSRQGGRSGFADRGESEGGGEGDGADGQEAGKDKAAYLERIPSNAEAQEACHKKYREAAIDLGLVYKDDLKEPRTAIETYEKLLGRYAEFDDRPRVLYTLYLLYGIQSDAAAAQKASSEVLSRYPDSDFAALIRNGGRMPESVDACTQLYVEAYARFQQGSYSSSVALCDQGLVEFPVDPLKPQFELLHALGRGGMSDRSGMVTELERLTTTYSGKAVGLKAEEILKGLGVRGSSKNATGAANTGNPNQDPAMPPAPQVKPKSNYVYSPTSKHRFAQILEAEFDANDALAVVTEHCNQFHRFDKLRAQILPMGEFKLVVVNGLNNSEAGLKFIETYRSDPKMVATFGDDGVLDCFIIAQENFIPFFEKQDLLGYLSFFSENY
ncbi:tetratricopeptide repeat protein [bacterium]|nr:tetratricopeptide repeat protein [bacterium]